MDEHGDLGRPIRVVIFTGGPTLDRAVVRFAEMLQAHQEIEFVGGFSETGEQGLAAMVRERVRRRGVLGIALLTAEAAGAAARFLARPRAERELRRKAGRLAEQITFTPDIHAEESLARIRQLQPDLGLVYGGPILKPRLFTIPQLGTLGIHHGKVPQYRGKKTTFWAMYNGDPTVGVTIQHINAGVDAGMIVERGEVPTAGKWLPHVSHELEQLGFQLYIQAIVGLKRGTARFTPQSGPKGRLYRDPKVADLLRFWLRQILRSFTSVA